VRPWPYSVIHVWVPSFWTWRTLGGAIWNFAKGTELL